jgi:cell division protein DivIC
MKINKEISKWILNRYIITIVLFMVWLVFFDENNLISQIQARGELNKLRAEKKYFSDKIDDYTFQLNALDTDPGFVEKYAREHYYFSKENEDIFVVELDTIKNIN